MVIDMTSAKGFAVVTTSLAYASTIYVCKAVKRLIRSQAPAQSPRLESGVRAYPLNPEGLNRPHPSL